MKKIIVPAKYNYKGPWQTMIQVEVKPKCKTCGKGERRNGSAYCQDCAKKYINQILND